MATGGIAQTSVDMDDEQKRIRRTYQRIVSLLANPRYKNDVLRGDCMRRTVLHHASLRGWLGIVQCLLKEGADPNVKDSNHRTPIFLATYHRHREIVDLLIKSGADIFHQDLSRQTLLHLAAATGWVDFAQFLLQQGADPNSVDRRGRTPLHMAVAATRKDTVSLLLDNGADADLCDERGTSALHFAVMLPQPLEIVKCLVVKGANVNSDRFEYEQPLLVVASNPTLDPDNKLFLTPLHLACKDRQIETIEYLANAMNIKNGTNETPINFIMSYNPNLDMIKAFLRRYGYNTNFIDNYYDDGLSLQYDNIFRNSKVCAEAILSKFNNTDLPYFYSLPLPDSAGLPSPLPPVHKLMVTSRRMTEDIEQSVSNEISTNGYVDLIRPKVIQLRMLSVKSYIEYYESLPALGPKPVHQIWPYRDRPCLTGLTTEKTKSHSAENAVNIEHYTGFRSNQVVPEPVRQVWPYRDRPCLTTEKTKSHSAVNIEYYTGFHYNQVVPEPVRQVWPYH